MSSHHSSIPWCALAAAALVLVTPHEASAVQLFTQVTTISQVGTSAGVRLGHAASGSTNYNRLIVGGAYTVQCASPAMLPSTGQRTLSTENVVGGLSLVTTIPQWVPTTVNMPGFDSLAAGSVVSCTYGWTSKAVEGGYSVGAGGISYQTGNGERADGGTRLFIMTKAGTSDANDTRGCIP